jgi:hypothetical protein
MRYDGDVSLKQNNNVSTVAPQNTHLAASSKQLLLEYPIEYPTNGPIVMAS